MRPPIVSGTPSEYKELMEQCWDANPKNRPKIETLLDAIKGINKKFREKNNNESFQHDLNDKNNTLKVYTNNSKISELLIKSKMHRFEDLPEPKNASEEEQKALHHEFYKCDDAYSPNLHPEEQDGLEIPDNIE
ncbi:unnamed protein product [Rhizophagus irregularis]|nr:unnamed protein product [Rhizophagus irregularis]